MSDNESLSSENSYENYSNLDEKKNKKLKNKIKEIDIKPKKKPGRPKKLIDKKPVPKLGIVAEPSNNSITDPRLINIFEIIYDNPIMFKKIFSLFKLMSVENIRMRLDKKNIKMYTVDHKSVNQIYINIYGDKMNQYYTSKVIEFGLCSTNIQKILQTLNKDCSKIYWFTNVQYERSKIKIGLSTDEMEEDSIYTIDVDQVENYNWDVENDLKLEDQYPLKFDLPFKYFKKKVSDFKLLGEIMKIEKHGDHPLKLSYNFSNNKGDQHTSFKNSNKINLRSTINADEIFSTSVFLEHIKPLSSSLIADTIQIAACVDHKLIFTALLDQDEKSNKEKIIGTEKCEIKVLTNIVTAKNN